MGITPDISYINQGIVFLQTFSLDAILAAVIVVLLLGFSLHYGKGSIIALMFSLYGGILAYSYFPYSEQFLLFKSTETQLYVSNILLFTLFVAIIHFVTTRVTYSDFPEKTSGRLIEAGVLSVSATILLLAIFYNVLPSTTLYNFGDPINDLFESTPAFFLSLAVPLLAVLLTTRR